MKKIEISEQIENKIDKVFKFSVFPILLIFLIGFFIRLYFTPFDLPSRSSDAFNFIIIALSFQDSWENIAGRYYMWSGLLSLIFIPFNFGDYDGYFTIIRLVTISISAVSGLIFYAIAKEIMSKKFALLAMAFFVIEPNIIENSIFGLSESLFLILGLTSFYFTINKSHKFFLLSFVFAGLAFDARTSGAVLFVVPLVALYLRPELKKQFLKYALIGTTLFMIIITPTILDFNSRIGEELSFIDPSLTKRDTPSFEHGSFIKDNKYLGATVTGLVHIIRISIPYLFLFVPIGIFAGLKRFDWQIRLIAIIISLTFVMAIPQYTVSVEYRNLFFITPFLCILSAIGVQHLTSKMKIRNLVLIIIIISIIPTSAIFLSERQPDVELILEKERFAKYLISNFEGTITGSNWNYIKHNIKLPVGSIIVDDEGSKIQLITPDWVIHDRNELIDFLTEFQINYVVVDNERDIRFPVFSEILSNEEDFKFLKKIYDASEFGYQNYKGMLYKVDFTNLAMDKESILQRYLLHAVW